MLHIRSKRSATSLLLALALTLLLTSCVSSPEVIETPVAPPAIDFPAFPDPTDRVSVDDDGAVTMDADYWVSIAEYAIRVEAVREIYEGFRDIYGTE